MKLDEAIAHAREVSSKKYEGMLCHANPNDEELDGCIECAEEHERLAKWLEELQQYREIGTVEECRKAVEVKKGITEIVDRQLIAGKNNYKEVYDCFHEIVKNTQDNY